MLGHECVRVYLWAESWWWGAGKARKRGHDADAEGFADDMGGNAKRAKTESARWGVFQQGTSSQPACQQQSACNAITIHQLDNNLL